MIETSLIAPCVAYRGRAEGEAARGQRMTGELETGIERPGSETVMAVAAEQVPGATPGAVPAVPGYFRRTREICDCHGGLPILDKRICGMGRTETPFACDQHGIAPDIAAIAKGLGAGSQPVGAMLRTARLQNANEASSGPFLHGHTHMGHPTAAALTVLTRLARDGPLTRAQIMSERLEAALRAALGELPCRRHPRRGPVSRHRAGQRPRQPPHFPPERRTHARIEIAAFEAGRLCHPMGGTIDGRQGDQVLLAPSLTPDGTHALEITDKLQFALTALR
ncbi:aminotransferase class III-fold pyridoxal phosphate-dependent enzyme [Rhodovulum sulfidophilum]|nr:aminotransferase class III-fold pyridoxal phosphate-dependent enzyme [Rhodovulum sulfidophilum]MCE8457456.1 aminotransferase class III-fold pyridoxal phosphate-dependent enzyme [Rhodovulum sulfidophilum]